MKILGVFQADTGNFGGGAGGIREVKDEGVSLGTSFTKMNFVGPGVTAAVDGGDPNQVNVTIGGGAASQADQWVFGSRSILVTTATRYLSPYYSRDNAQVQPARFRAFKGGTLKNLRIRHQSVGGNANTITYTVRLNGVATALTASIAANDATLNTQDLVNTVAVAAGDLVDLEVTKSGNIGSSPFDVLATLEWSNP